MKKIYIGFSSPKSGFVPFATAIRAVLRTPYAHTYLRYSSGEMKQDMVFQASGIAVNLVSYKQFINIENVVKEFEIDVTDDQFDMLIQEFSIGLGQPYSVLQILNTFCYILARSRPLSTYINGWDCSRLMEAVLQSLGYNITQAPDVVTPKDVYNYLESLTNAK